MKKKRQAEILRIISTNEVETQEMLLKLLRERGYDVTQATVSRDINEMNIEKPYLQTVSIVTQRPKRYIP